jgi:Uma2 family endonuclease
MLTGSEGVMKAEDKKGKAIREQPLTYDDYAALPEDGNRYELVGGVLELMSPSASVRHQMISAEIQYTLKQSCESEYITLDAPLDVILSETEVRQPDLIMIHRSRLNIITKRGIEGAPDLVVEILSPSSIKRDKVSKLKSYAQYEIPEYWIVDPSNGVLEQYILQVNGYDLTEVYAEDELVRSANITCVSFSMNEIMSKIPDLPNVD